MPPEYKKAYVTVMVDNMDKSVEFYGNLLGLYEDLRFGDSWAEMTTKGITIGLHPKKVGAPSNSPSSSSASSWAPHQGGPASPKGQEKVVHPPPPQVSIGFEVEDIRKTAQELEAKGIRFHFQENEVNILAFFVDPDGTPLYLTQVR